MKTQKIETLTRQEAYELVDKFAQVGKLTFDSCIKDGKWSYPNHGAAHAHLDDGFDSCICFSDYEYFLDKQTLLHEIAHVVARDTHTAKWDLTLQQIGGQSEAWHYIY